MKVKVVLNAKNAYCSPEELAEYFYELNYCDARKVSDDEVELVFNQAQLKMVYDEFYTLENFVRDAIAKYTEAAFAYTVNLNDIVERVDVEFKDFDEIGELIF